MCRSCAIASPRNSGIGSWASHTSVARATARRAQTLAFPSLPSCCAAWAAASSCSISVAGVTVRLFRWLSSSESSFSRPMGSNALSRPFPFRRRWSSSWGRRGQADEEEISYAGGRRGRRSERERRLQCPAQAGITRGFGISDFHMPPMRRILRP